MGHILAHVSYRRLLENLFGGVEEQAPDVPILSKIYEESMMRQPMSGERQCAMGDMCECMFIDRSAPFVGVELRFPPDPPEAQLCLLCSRALTQKCFYDICFLNKRLPGVIQRFGNIFGQPGEYSPECMLMLPQSVGLSSMPIPAMSHQRNKYSVVSQGGVKYLRQHRVRYEDFHQAPSTDAP